MSPTIECIPNFSEGRDQTIIRGLEDIVRAIEGVHLLHSTSDHDHNRTVLTFAGDSEAVQETAFQLIKFASENIDMTTHRGVHPRIGATDVVPFVPLDGATMADCITIAQTLGKRVGDDLNVPVYLYANATTRPERKNLADIRRGQYEGLAKKIHLPEHQPDFGPAQLGTAGAVVIGARNPLIAYNVYLTTDDVSIAKNIARAIRGSSGGLVGVKALGLLVNGHAQVSMNLTDYQRTPLYQVMALIQLEAQRYGVQIHSSELIGLIPRDALTQSALWYLQLPDSAHDQILENRLSESKPQNS
ncbi:MAG: glutamate formimidoyltransferase [Chloroflexota bacterium]